jgi:hypothetical protein
MTNLVGEEQKAQATQMIALRVQGWSIAEIAKHFRCSTDTVERRLHRAKRENLLQNAVNTIIEKALPMALNTYLVSMTQTDDPKLALEAARDVMFGTGTLSKNNKAQVAPDEKKELTLRAWREKRFAKDHQTGATRTVTETSVLELTGGVPEGVEPDGGNDAGEDVIPAQFRVADDDEVEEGI